MIIGIALIILRSIQDGPCLGSLINTVGQVYTAVSNLMNLIVRKCGNIIFGLMSHLNFTLYGRTKVELNKNIRSDTANIQLFRVGLIR